MKRSYAAGLAGLAALLCLALSGCGLKGPLYLPGEPAPASVAAQSGE